MGHKNHSLVQFVLQQTKLALDIPPRNWIQSAKRLVQENQRGIGRQGPSHADPLSLSPREFVRKPIDKAPGVEADELKQFPNAPLDAFAFPTFEAWDHGNILFDSQMGKEADFLYHITDPPAQLNGIPFESRSTLDPHFTRRRIQQSVDQFDRRCLPGTAATQEHYSFASLDFQVEIREQRLPVRQPVTHAIEYNGFAWHLVFLLCSMPKPGHSSEISSIVSVSMKQQTAARIIAAEKRRLWHSVEPSIWGLTNPDGKEDPVRSIMRTLWDQPRWLEAYHLYDERGAELFEQICDLPEYYLTRTENSILEQQARKIVAAAPVTCIMELGAGSAKKTTHLLRAQCEERGSGIFAPIDVSLPGLLASRDFVRHEFPAIEFHGLCARYEDGFSAIDASLPKLVVFLGSTIGNFTPPAFTRFFALLTASMGPNDYLLVGADRIKDVAVLESAYDDSRGLTAEFILNAFQHINRLAASNFDRGGMRYYATYNAEWRQIEMYAISTAAQFIHFPAYGVSFCWEKDEKILVEISRKFDPSRLQQQLAFFDLTPVKHFTDAREWFSLLLFRKNSRPSD